MSDWVKGWLQESDKQARKRDERLSKICRNRKIIEVLERYGNRPERLKEIFTLLETSGVGEKAAWSVVKSPNRLEQFFQLEADRVEFLEIVSRLMKW